MSDRDIAQLPTSVVRRLDKVVVDNPPRALVLGHIADERQQQDVKWGEQNHRDGTGASTSRVRAANIARRLCQIAADEGTLTWRLILAEEVAEAAAESDPAKLRAELIQVAAVAAAWAEAIDRRPS